MPFATIKLRPGVNTQLTLAANEAGVSASNLIRYKDQIVQKIGGWNQYYSQTFTSTIREIHGWQDLSGNQRLAVATTGSLNVITAGSGSDITPQTRTSDFIPFFSVSSGSDVVTIMDPGSSLSVFDSVFFNTPVAVDGLLLNGAYYVNSVGGSSTYTIISSQIASTTVTTSGILPIFQTVANQATVTVTLPNNNFPDTIGLFVTFYAPTTVGGITIQGPYQVNTIIDSTQFTITSPTQAVTTDIAAMNGTGNDIYTKILLHMDSTGFPDANLGGTTHTWTAVNSATIETSNVVFGLGAGSFAISSGYITTPDNADFALSSNDFTFDTWFNITSTSSGQMLLAGQIDAAVTSSLASFFIDRLGSSANSMRFITFSGTASFSVQSSQAFTSTANTGWHHLAVTRTSSVLTLFVDGVAGSSTIAITGTVNDSSAAFSVGRAGAVVGSGWGGFVDEFRLSNGIARWTANFTPPTIAYGGYAEVVYYIAIGPPPTAGGYGVGGYGLGGYGIGSPATGGTGTPITADDWTLDNWGEALIACVEDGPIYVWAPRSGFTNASVITTAPFFNGGIFISMPQQILVAWRSTQSTGTQDPLVVRWSDAEDYTNWEITSATAAGRFHIPTGSRIIGGLQGPSQAMIWTDVDAWAMQYVGGDVIFNFTRLGSGCGLIGMHAAGVIANTIYWCGNGFQFFRLGAQGVEPLQCTVWDFIFQNLNTAYQDRVRCAPNSTFNEIAWFFPSTNSAGENDSYVKYNILENEWDYGTLQRVAWIDVTALGTPIGTDTTTVYQHEMGYNNVNQPISPFFESGYWSIAEGNVLAYVDWVLPDMKFGTFSGAKLASCEITFLVTDYPGDTPKEYGPYTFTNATQYITTRFRGRFMAIRIASNDANSFWRLGSLRYRWAPAGGR